jgi:hypothetical protein
MKSQKGGNKKGKKGGKKKGGGGKKPPQQAPRGDEKPGVALPEAERDFVPGLGCMVTKSWVEALQKRHFPLAIEIARANLERCHKVTDVQSRASLLRILGHSLMQILEKEAMEEGRKCNLAAMKLIWSMGERSAWDIMFGVWPEGCAMGWDDLLKHMDPSERIAEMEWMREMVNLTRQTINFQLEKVNSPPENMKKFRWLSQDHYKAELKAIYCALCGSFSLSENDIERWLAIFGKRVEEIETILEREGCDLQDVKDAKANQLILKCNLYEKQGKMELALDMLREAVEEEGHHVILIDVHAQMSLKTGRFEEAFKLMETFLSFVRSRGGKTMAVPHFGHYLSLVPEESRSMFRELIPKYPHVLWVANAAGFFELSEEEKNALRSQLEEKRELACVNCNKELSKIYRCSGCEVATYCGTTCQKEACKEQIKICKKRE